MQPRGNPAPGACSSTQGARGASLPLLPQISAIWHILLTCAPFAGGLSNQPAVFTRHAPTPRAHSLKIWRSCAHSFRGSPLACLNFPLKLREQQGSREMCTQVAPGLWSPRKRMRGWWAKCACMPQLPHPRRRSPEIFRGDRGWCSAFGTFCSPAHRSQEG